MTDSGNDKGGGVIKSRLAHKLYKSLNNKKQQDCCVSILFECVSSACKINALEDKWSL